MIKYSTLINEIAEGHVERRLAKNLCPGDLIALEVNGTLEFRFAIVQNITQGNDDRGVLWDIRCFSSLNGRETIRTHHHTQELFMVFT